MFSLIPILPNRIKGLPVAFLLLFGILNYKKNPISWKWFFINASLFLTYLFSIFVVESGGQYYKIIERSFSIIILPFVFHLLLNTKTFEGKLVEKFLKTFVVSSVIFSVIIIVATFLDDTTVYYQDWYTNKARTVMENFPIIGQHPIYGSIFFGLSILFCFELLKRNLSRTFYLILLGFNGISLLFFLSKGVVIGTFLGITFLIMAHYRFSKKSLSYLLILALLFSSLFLFNRRMREMISFKTYEKVDTNYSNSIRLGIYSCVSEILKEDWLLGVGVGNAQKALDDCYQNKSEVLLQKLYNSHNQYLDVWLKTGILGLFIFLIFLGMNIRKAIYNRNYFLLSILLFFGIIFLAENALSRQTGIIIFYFLITFFNHKIATLEAE